MVIAPPLICVDPAASVVRVVNGFVPPTTPPNVVVPLLTVSERAVASELTVPFKATLPPVRVVFAPSTTLSP